MFCPACISGAVLLAASATSTGGLAVLVKTKLGGFRGTKGKQQPASDRISGLVPKENLHGSKARNAA
jgi:hypothetical protein